MANAITLIRIVCALSLIFCPAFSKPFFIVYILGGASDVLDGAAARYLKTESPLGARLDTAADIAFTAIALLKAYPFFRFPPWLTVWILFVAFVKCACGIAGFMLHGHFVSEHTYLNKACGVLLFVIPLCAGFLPYKAFTALAYAAVAIASVAAVQEGYYIFKGKEFR